MPWRRGGTLKSHASMSRDDRNMFNDSNGSAEKQCRRCNRPVVEAHVNSGIRLFFLHGPTPDGWPCLAIMQRKDVGKGVAIKFGEFGERCRSNRRTRSGFHRSVRLG